MVDPNRKINRLTDKDIAFLDECEEEFAARFTKEDPDFITHSTRALVKPPVEDNWNNFSNNGNRNEESGDRYNSNNRGNFRSGRNRRGNYHHRHHHTRYNFGQRESYPNYKSSGNMRNNVQVRSTQKKYENFVSASKNT